MLFKTSFFAAALCTSLIASSFLTSEAVALTRFETRLSIQASPQEEVELSSFPTLNFAKVASTLNSFSSFNALMKNLEQTGLATSAECSAILTFLKDRGLSAESSLEKTKVSSDGTSDTSWGEIRWGDIGFTQIETGELKNSNGQILSSVTNENLDVVFGDAFLSFDKRSARAKVMEFFMPEAQAATVPLIQPRATAAMAALLFAAKERALALNAKTLKD